MSGTENWTLALSWDPGQRALRGIIHGLQGNEVSSLVTYLDDTREESIHPMNLAVVLCEMLTEGDSNGIKRRATELYQVEIRTNYHGYPRDETIEVCALHTIKVHENLLTADRRIQAQPNRQSKTLKK